MIFAMPSGFFCRSTGMDIEIFGLASTSKFDIPRADRVGVPYLGLITHLLPKKGTLLDSDPPSPRQALVTVGSIQKDGTPTSPSVRIIFAYTFMTHPPTLAMESTPQCTPAACELTHKLALS